MRASVSILCSMVGLLLGSVGCIQPDTSRDKDEPEVDLDGDGVASDEDCDDTDDRVAPGLDEVCDGIDNDCDLQVDDEATDAVEAYWDEDGDGFGEGAPGLRCTTEGGYSTQDGDCDDSSPDIHPGATEICDGQDQDCDEEVDEDADDAPTWYMDQDGDGYGGPNIWTRSCEAPEGYVDNSDDCGPQDAAVSPEGVEVCDDADLDEDCDDTADDDDTDTQGMLTWYLDQDGDGLGSDHGTVQGCEPPRGYAATADDCDDADPTTAGVEALYLDLDGDGYGDPSEERVGCAGDPGTSTDNLDCDDDDATVNPGVYDAPYDGVDQDCDATSDYDADADGYDSEDYGGDDCGDADPTMSPAAAEVYYDGIDQNCDDASDYDADEDGFDSDVYGGEDCDDTSTSSGPTAAEAPLDGDDQDCDGEDLTDAAWLISATAGAYAGYAVAVADLSGDGVNEVITSAPYISSGGGWIYAMAGDDLAVVDALDSADAMVKGSSSVYAGIALNADLDADGDGYTDLLVGALNESSVGSVSVMLGPISASMSLTSRDAVVKGEWRYGYAGRALDWAGDVDGDGEEDLIYGAPYADETGTNKGMAVLALGPAASLTDDVAQLEGQYSNDQAGTAVAGAGDTDGDGLADIAVGAPYNNDQGAVYVLNGPVSGSFELADADAKWRGNVDGDNLGVGLLGGFDANGDGYTDLWMGANGESTAATDAGAIYLVEGPFTKKADVEVGVAVVYGLSASDVVGQQLWQGDLNGDGEADLLVGAPQEGSANYGTAYAMLGPLSGSISVGDTEHRWTASTSNANAGASVAAGDVDGDGQMDVVSGASGYTPFDSYAGSVYVLYGGW